MAIQTIKSAASYQQDILNELANSGIKNLAPGGKARALADIVGNKLGELETRQFMNLANNLVPFATGNALDLICQIYGVYRIQQQDAVVSNSDQNFQFYVRTGTFGDINLGQPINIPANVQISTNSTNGPVYLTNAVTLQPGDSSTFFSATSLYSGSSGNTAAGVFSQHNFTNYADVSYASLLVTNQYGMIGGRDQEDDNSLRYRLSLKLQSQSGMNEAAIRFALLQLPGIQDVSFVTFAGGFYVYIYGITPVVPPSVLQLVNNTIVQTTGFPITGTALTPDLVGITLDTALTFTPGLTQDQKTSITLTAQTAAANYINNLTISQTLVINDIASAIRNSDARISNVGLPNKQIENIYIWRSRSDGTRYSRFLIDDYSPAQGERIITELSQTQPITIGQN